MPVDMLSNRLIAMLVGVRLAPGAQDRFFSPGSVLIK